MTGVRVRHNRMKGGGGGNSSQAGRALARMRRLAGFIVIDSNFFHRSVKTIF
jgi:hypothetical protein